MWGQKCFFQRVYVWRQLLYMFCFSKSHYIKCEILCGALFCNYVYVFSKGHVRCIKVERKREMCVYLPVYVCVYQV